MYDIGRAEGESRRYVLSLLRSGETPGDTDRLSGSSIKPDMGRASRLLLLIVDLGRLTGLFCWPEFIADVSLSPRVWK